MLCGLSFKRKDYSNAERHWLAYLATKPPPANAATEYANLANYAWNRRAGSIGSPAT